MSFFFLLLFVPTTYFVLLSPLSSFPQYICFPLLCFFLYISGKSRQEHRRHQQEIENKRGKEMYMCSNNNNNNKKERGVNARSKAPARKTHTNNPLLLLFFPSPSFFLSRFFPLPLGVCMITLIDVRTCARPSHVFSHPFLILFLFLPLFLCLFQYHSSPSSSSFLSSSFSLNVGYKCIIK